MPLQMKEDVMVAEVRENLGGSFNELGGLDDVNEEPDSCCVMLSEAVVNVFGILDVKAGRFNQGLVFYFLNDCEVVRGSGRRWRGRSTLRRVYGLVNGIGRIEGSGNYVKVRVKGDKSTGEVRGDVGGRAHNEVIGKGKGLESKKLDKAKEVRVLPDDITSVH
jgi:hypothetical protein